MRPTIALLAGPQFLGICFNWALLGLLNLQVYLYYDHYPNDRLFMKCLAYGMLIFEWVQTGLLTAGGMEIYVYNYGDLLSLVQFHNAWFALTIMCGIVSATVQTFFAWRIHRLSKSRILASCIIVLASVQVMASIVAGVLERKVKLASEVQGGTMKAAAVWLAGSAAADMLIAVSMVVLLLRRKSGIARTDALINRMVRLVVETGSLTAGFSILVIIFAICAPLRDTLVYQTPALVLTKLYSNTLLTNLNSRDYIRKREQYVVELAPVGSGKPVHHAAAQHGTFASTPVSSKSDTSIGAHDARLKGPSAEKYTLPPATDHVVRQGRMDDAAPRENLRARRNSVV